jgi:GNAT superfamily N-acetyltransferase
MGTVHYREGNKSDISAMARIRASEWGTEEYWIKRITGYIDCELHPQKALMPRIIFVAGQSGSLIGLVAGHLTRRYDCEGELEWINVIPEHRGDGTASELLRLLAGWFFQTKSIANLCGRGSGEHHRAPILRTAWSSTFERAMDGLERYECVAPRGAQVQ